MHRKVVLLSTVLFFLTSCGTREFRAEEAMCTATWMKISPPLYEQEQYNDIQFHTREVPTGQMSCTSSGGHTRCTGYGNRQSCYTTSTDTQCTQIMRTENYTTQQLAVRTVDRNKINRDIQISACTQNTCNQKYGNAKCKK